MNIIDFLKETTNYCEKEKELKKRPILVCKDGFYISVQASRLNYSSPKKDLLNGEYYAVELGYPNRIDELILDYAEDKENPLETIYGFVPIEIVDKLIKKHGGINIYCINKF